MFAAVALFAVVLCGCGSNPKPSASAQVQASHPRTHTSTNKTDTHASTKTRSPSANGNSGSRSGSAHQSHSPKHLPYSQSVLCYPSGKALVGKNLSKIPRDKLAVITKRPTIIRIQRLPNGTQVGTCVFGDSSGAAGL